MAKKKSDKSTIVKSIPSSETGARTGCKTKSGKEYLITNNPIKEKFTLWLVVPGGYKNCLLQIILWILIRSLITRIKERWYE